MGQRDRLCGVTEQVCGGVDERSKSSRTDVREVSRSLNFNQKLWSFGEHGCSPKDHSLFSELAESNLFWSWVMRESDPCEMCPSV